MSYGAEFRSRSKARVVIMGASAKHDSGELVCGADNVTLAALASKSHRQIVELISDKNKQLKKFAYTFGFDFMDLEPSTSERIDAHTSPIDCTHYCQPGIPDIW